MKDGGLVILAWLIMTGCISTKDSHQNVDHSKELITRTLRLRVFKIDSVNSFYLIYGTRDSTMFKIVSKKIDDPPGRKIHLNRRYKFSLTSIWRFKMNIYGTNVSLSSMPTVNCLAFDSVTNICLEREKSINDLYYADNVKGLYFQPDK